MSVGDDAIPGHPVGRRAILYHYASIDVHEHAVGLNLVARGAYGMYSSASIVRDVIAPEGPDNQVMDTLRLGASAVTQLQTVYGCVLGEDAQEL
jgi:hypothetical protein